MTIHYKNEYEKWTGNNEWTKRIIIKEQIQIRRLKVKLRNPQT